MKKAMIVVDDDADILNSIKTLFEHEGYKVTAVKNGRECIHRIEQGFKGVVLLDIMMPEMDGWDTIRAIVEKDLITNVNIFLITAIGTSNHEKMKGLEPYIRDYIAKPFNPDTLIQSVSQTG